MLKPPPTPMLPTTVNDVSMLFGQKPIYEEMDEWDDESVEIARKGSSVALDETEVYIPALSGWKHDGLLARLKHGMEMADLILEDEVYTGRGEKSMLDDRCTPVESSFGIEESASGVESELPSVYLAKHSPRAPTPVRDDFFHRRLSSSRKRSASLVSLVASPFVPRRLMDPTDALLGSAIVPMTAIPTSDSAASLAHSVGSWTSEEKSIMQVQMAWRSKPEMLRAKHIRTDSLLLREAARTTDDEEEVLADPPIRRPFGRPSLARFGPPRRIINPPESPPRTAVVDEPLEYGRYDVEQALLVEDEPRIPLTIPLNISTSSRHSRYPSSSSVLAIAPITSVEDIPFPTLADTSGSGESIDSRSERRKSRSHKLLSFFTGFLTGADPTPDIESPSPGKEETGAERGHPQAESSRPKRDREVFDDSVELPRAVSTSEDSFYHFEAPIPRVRVMRTQHSTSRPNQHDFIELQPPAFDDEDIRSHTRSSNAPYFALKPSRTVPSASSNIAADFVPMVNHKGKGRQTMSAFACAALARLPPPGKGASAAGQPVTIRDSERARDLDRRKLVFEGPSRVVPRPMPMKRTIPIVGRTPGKASRARAMQRGAFDQGVRERLEMKVREKRKLEHLREDEEARTYKKSRRETVIRATPLPEMYRR